MRRIVLLAAIAAAASAHVGSPDIFLEGSAGPYPLFITIQPPPVIPGAAQIMIRSSDPDLRELRITPLPMTGEASKHPPAPDILQPSKLDLRSFTGMCWLMQTGSMQVRIQADGAKGTGLLSVPVPAVATRTKTMDRALGAGLFVMLLVLFFGVISIVGAASRESRLEPGVSVDTRHIRRGRMMMGVVSAILVAALWGGWVWWNSEADDYSLHIYRPTQMHATLGPHDRLQLQLEPPAGRAAMPDDFLPDHDHLMHLYVIHWPDFARVWHLHPELTSELTSGATFTHSLPPMPAGTYKLYADVVHRSGFPETLVTDWTATADIAGTPLSGDDAAGSREPSTTGTHIVWDRDAAPLHPRQAGLFKFRLVDKDGQPVTDAELYMGMAGHAAFVKIDGTVFAHVHPSGSVPMAALELANPPDPRMDQKMDHSMHMMHRLAPEASFPYGFPSAGDYKIIVQMKHGGVIETGIFDAKVE